MEFEKQNKLPEGMGKKIIEALKTNREDEIYNNSEYKIKDQNNYYTQDEYLNKNQKNWTFQKNEDRSSQEPDYKNYNYNYELNSQNYCSNNEEYREQRVNNKEAIGSSNINTLVNLVTKLPPGVTKQTGAQIIRHTMEAMGISMNKVLTNAQIAQEELEQDIRNNINVIEEYRAKIKILDQEIQQFRKKSQDLENIISLFILSDNQK